MFSFCYPNELKSAHRPYALTYVTKFKSHMTQENIENYYIYWHGSSIGFSLSEDDAEVKNGKILATLE